MRGELVEKILELILETSTTAFDLAETIISSPYGSSAGHLQKTFERLHERWGDEAPGRFRKECSDMIFYLKSKGFIEETGAKREKRRNLVITNRGISKLKNLKERFKNAFPDKRSYASSRVAGLIIVTFDIPEKERRKRDWLRSALKNIGFEQIQKSVFFGKVKLPQNFVQDIDKLGLLKKVEIFEISKTGTLKKF